MAPPSSDLEKPKYRTDGSAGWNLRLLSPLGACSSSSPLSPPFADLKIRLWGWRHTWSEDPEGQRLRTGSSLALPVPAGARAQQQQWQGTKSWKPSRVRRRAQDSIGGVIGSSPLIGKASLTWICISFSQPCLITGNLHARAGHCCTRLALKGLSLPMLLPGHVNWFSRLSR